MNTNTSSKKSPLKFILLVILLTIPFWVLSELSGNGLPLPVNLPLSALMFVCPILATLILVYQEEKLEGIRKLFKDAFNDRKFKKRWLVPSLLLMPLISLISYGIMLLLGRPLPEPDIPLLMIPVFFVLYFVSAVGEELGFMGYLIKPLLSRWNALVSGLIMGVVWAGWHVIPYIQANNTWKWIVGQCMFTIFARVLIVWLYKNTEDSILPGILFHAMINVCWSVFPNYGSHYDPIIIGTITAIVAVIVASIWGPKSLNGA